MDLLADSESTPWTTEILVDNKQEAEALELELKKLPLVDDVTWLNKFIPEDQDNKLFIIEEMDIILSGMNLNSALPAPTVEERITAINKLHLLMITRQQELNQIPLAEDLLTKLEAFLKHQALLDIHHNNVF